MKCKILFIVFFLLIGLSTVHAQKMQITGTVIDNEGYEVIGGSITIKGTTGMGTVTDVNGKYTLTVNDASKDVLVFSYVGMITQEVKVNGQKTINVTLKADANVR